MSGLAIYFTPEEITFATDTLATKNDGFSVQPVNSVSKVDYYQHLKCCVVSLGYTRLGSDYYSFINDLVLSDMVDLVNLTEKYFLDLIDVDLYDPGVYADEKDRDHLGSLYVMGFSNQLNRLCAYRITVGRYELSVVEMSMDAMKFVHPPIGPEAEARILTEMKGRTDVKAHEIMVEFVKQMAEDSKDKEKFSVHVGMEIHVTQLLNMGGNFLCQFGIPVRLDGFEENLKEMAKHQEIKLFAKAHHKHVAKMDKLFASLEK